MRGQGGRAIDEAKILRSTALDRGLRCAAAYFADRSCGFTTMPSLPAVVVCIHQAFVPSKVEAAFTSKSTGVSSRKAATIDNLSMRRQSSSTSALIIT
jgi:hypothetical protein